MTTQALVLAVRQHALHNYNDNGWDFVVECFEDSDILERVDEGMTEQQAIAAVYKLVRLLNEQRQAAYNEVF
jgi:hypothetical protein